MEYLAPYAFSGEPLNLRYLLTPEEIRACEAGSPEAAALSAVELAPRLFERDLTPAEGAAVSRAARWGVRVELHRLRLDREALASVTPRRAWQFQVIPIRRQRGMLIVATTERWLGRAMRYARRLASEPVRLVLADEVTFRRHLEAYYRFPGAESLAALRPREDERLV